MDEDFEMYDDLWFEDGTAVLRADQTLFRIHRDLLASQSAILHALFASAQDTYEDCVLVQLNDNEEDVRLLLSALYHWNFLASPLSDEKDALALLQITAKYQFQALRSTIVNGLEPYFPTTYDSWTSKRHIFGKANPFSRKGAIIAFANVARDAAPSLLPAALLSLFRYYEGRNTPFNEGKFRGQPVVLDASLELAVLRGRLALSRVARTKVFLSLFSPPAGEDDIHSKCNASKAANANSLSASDGTVNPFQDPLHVSTWKPGCCEKCQDTLKADWQVGARDTWNGLSLAFGLPEWNILRREDSATAPSVDIVDESGSTRCGDLWIPEGTVVLRAGTMLFRVYKDILAKQSPFFAEMFALPQPPAGEQYDGVPILDMHDTTEDARALLCAMYRPYSMFAPSRTALPALPADELLTLTLLGMSHKYQVMQIRATLLAALEPYFPTTYAGWQERVRQERFIPEGVQTPFSSKGAIIGIANAAEVLAPQLLPAALLALVPYSAQASLGEPFAQARVRQTLVASLRPTLELAVLRARPVLDDVARGQAYTPLATGPLGHCRRPGPCAEACKHTLRKLLDAGRGHVNPFLYTKDLPGWDPALFCRRCLQDLELRFSFGMPQVWEQLPVFFGLPEWNVLLGQGDVVT